MATPRSDHPATAKQLRERMLADVLLTERHVRLGTVSTAVVEGGRRSTDRAAPRQGEFCAVWLRVLDDLVRTHHVIVVDLPGRGGSTDIEGSIDAETMVRWVDELIDATCAEPPVLVGHLPGGASPRGTP